MNDVNRTTPPGEAPIVAVALERRRKLRLPLMIGGAVLILAVTAFYYFLQRGYESTEDAYVNAARVAISSNVAGRIVDVEVRDNQRVRRGDVLFQLDDRPFQLAVTEAQARLDQTVLDVEALKATYRQKQSEVRSAADTLQFERRESERQQRLLSSGISSQAQVDRAAHARDAASQALAAAQQDLANVLANLGGDSTLDAHKHPSVERAQAALDRAKLDLSYTTIRAPDEGVVTQVNKIHAGDYVNAASPLFVLIATHDLWIEANFKEVQLSRMRVGQPVTVDIDTYGDRTFEGHVASISPGTGAQFSILPAQNATGNWVKVVQRLPVRVEIDDADNEHPLYAGLSATVKVDTRR
jgi:membrane fusion protein, multidrug efflux system